MSTTSPTFVDGLDLGGVIRTGTTRQFHRKSRTGCQKCRSRRVKCDEGKPHCRNCARLGGNCVYDRASPRAAQATHAPASESASTPSTTAEAIEDEPVESRERRMAELELMHFYVTETGPSIPFDKETAHDLYVKAIPRMAIKSQALLYSLFAIAALHKSTLEGVTPSAMAPDGTTAWSLHEQYSMLAFQNHRREIAQIHAGNIDLLYMTANLLRLMASFNLSQRSLEPYRPPVEWLRITKSHYNLYATAWRMVGDDQDTQVSAMTLSTFYEWKARKSSGDGDSDFIGKQCFGHLLEPVRSGARRSRHQDATMDNPELWDSVTREAFTSTANYVGEIFEAIQKKDKFALIARRLIIFPIMVDAHFVSLVEDSDPRALVVLAHYFALLTTLRDFWFVGDTGTREILALADCLPSPWVVLMEWPLQVVRDGL